MSEVLVTYVKPGETLSEIAVQYGVSVDALQQWNGIENPDLLHIGQRVVVLKGADVSGYSLSGEVILQTETDSHLARESWDIIIGSVIVIGLLWFLIRQFATDILRTLQVIDGERLVSSELRRHYSDWILINDVLLPTGGGTTQIDHILVSPSAVFLIETKDMNGWLFGNPYSKYWTQSFMAGHWSRRMGIKSKKFKFYNPLKQNEGHARALVKLGIVDHRKLRPIVIFVGDAIMKTADNFPPIDEHEKIAKRNRTYRMRGVMCTSMTELHEYIEFSVNATPSLDMSRRQMEMIYDKIRAEEISKTVESQAQHVEFVESVKQGDSW